MSLKLRTYSAIRWIAMAMVVKGGLQFFQLAILARLLVPADFGLMAVVVAVTSFLQIFADFGVSFAIIHQQTISREQLSSLYWLNVGSSIVLAVLIVLVSPQVAAYYLQPKLEPLLALSAIILVISAVGQQIRVVAEKNMRFNVLAKVEVAGAITGILFAVGIALAGGGVYALVGGAMANVAMLTVLLWLFLADGWRPMLVFRIREIHHFLKFGAYMIGDNLLNTVNSQVDVLLGAKIVGAQSIGAYSVTKEFCLGVSRAFNPIITRVGTPVMAKAQDDAALMKKVYLQTMRMTASVNFPVYVAIGVFAPEVVNIVFGHKWGDAVPLMQVFAAWALLRSTFNPVGSLLMAKGREDLSFKWNLALFFVFPPVLWLGSSWGQSGLALSSLSLLVMAFVPNWYFLVRPLCGPGFREYSRQFLSPLFASVAAATVALGAAWSLSGDVARLSVGVVVGGAVYVGLSSRINREWFVPMRALLRPGPDVTYRE